MHDDQSPNQHAAIRERLNRVNKVLTESEVMIKRNPSPPAEPVKYRPLRLLPFDLRRGGISDAHVDHNELEH